MANYDDEIRSAMRTGPPDMTGQYNTQLSPADEQAFQQWMQLNSAAQNRDTSQDLRDYDLRGAFKSGAATSENGHLPDTFKKPNHPTFSQYSQYNNTDGYTGGSWSQQPDGTYIFRASPTNLKMRSSDQLQEYFRRVEPDSKLMLPMGTGDGSSNTSR